MLYSKKNKRHTRNREKDVNDRVHKKHSKQSRRSTLCFKLAPIICCDSVIQDYLLYLKCWNNPLSSSLEKLFVWPWRVFLVQFGGQVIVVTKPNDSLDDREDVLIGPGISKLWRHAKPALTNHTADNCTRLTFQWVLCERLSLLVQMLLLWFESIY